MKLYLRISSKSEMTSALTPALSPRRGGIVHRILSSVI
jgi:hypothetical protein